MKPSQYIVIADDKVIGKWRTQKEAEKHVNRMMEFSSHKEIGWELVEGGTLAGLMLSALGKRVNKMVNEK
jgi:hypothetical protein